MFWNSNKNLLGVKINKSYIYVFKTERNVNKFIETRTITNMHESIQIVKNIKSIRGVFITDNLFHLFKGNP